MRRRGVFPLLGAVFFANVASPALLAGIPSSQAVYRGGTLAAPAPSTRGTVSVVSAEEFVFRYDGGALVVPYQRVNAIEYGQKAGRRLGLAIALSPAFLLSKKRKHYLTISFTDPQGTQHAAVFELGKKIVRTTLAGLEARTGLKIEFQDEEARKASRR
jgi:hypothetical protein